MKIAVLGCGPSGLVAAHAAHTAGHQVQIYSRLEKSPIHGAQYLHMPIAEMPADEPARIRYLMLGTPESYLTKVYGKAWDGMISDDLRDQEHLAWDMRTAYDWLWDTYNRKIVNINFTTNMFGVAHDSLTSEYDMIFNTLPRPLLCLRSHDFKSTTIWAKGQIEGEDFDMDFPGEEGDIIYNGDRSPGWYRFASIFGHKTVEWPEGVRPPVEGVALVRKPLSHNCDCWPEMIPVGRFGRWQNKKLVHEVYFDVYESIALKEMSK